MSEGGRSTCEPKGQPVSGRKQSTLLEQSSVNLAILESLERLNQNFATFSEYQYPENFFLLICTRQTLTLLTILILHLYTFAITLHCSYSHCLHKQTGRTHYTTYNINTILTFTLHYSFFYYYLVNFISL